MIFRCCVHYDVGQQTSSPAPLCKYDDRETTNTLKITSSLICIHNKLSKALVRSSLIRIPTMSTTTEEPAVAYSDIVKAGAGYENHDLQPRELVPGLEPHSTDDVSYAAVAREGPRARTASLTKRTNAPTTHTDEASARRSSSSSSSQKPLPPAKTTSELSIDMAANSPITLKRRVGQDSVTEAFPHPSIARARFAPDPRDGAAADSNARAAWESAVPSDSKRHWERRSAIEKHCAFFDTDLDGIISPRDTFTGLRALGFNLLMALFSTVVIHFGFAYLSQPGVLPDPFFRFHVGNAYHCKHGSDSNTYDTEGRYVPQKVRIHAGMMGYGD